MTSGLWLTEEQRRVLGLAARIAETNGERPFRSAAALGASPVVCGRLVTMRLLEGERRESKADDGSRTGYRITQAGLAFLSVRGGDGDLGGV